MKLFVPLVMILLLAGIASPAQSDSRATRRGERFGAGPKAGNAAPDFELKTVEGKPVHAAALWTNKPTVIMAGSYTCPVFRRQVEPFERLAGDFTNRVHFIVLYTQEAHPKGDHSPYRNEEWVTPANERANILVRQPKTMEERTQRARECTSAMSLSVPVVVDTLDNKTWAAYGSAPNSACLVGRDGKVIEYESWFEPEKMRTAIQRCLEKTGLPATGQK